MHENHDRILGNCDDSDDELKDIKNITDQVDEKPKKEVVNFPHNLRLCIEAELLSCVVRHNKTSNVIEVNSVKNQFEDIVYNIAKVCKNMNRSNIEQILKKEYLISSNPQSEFDYYQLQSISIDTGAYIRSSHSSVEVPQKKKGGSNRTIREEL